MNVAIVTPHWIHKLFLKHLLCIIEYAFSIFKKNPFNRTQAFIIDMRENFAERIPFEEEVLKIFGPY